MVKSAALAAVETAADGNGRNSYRPKGWLKMAVRFVGRLDRWGGIARRQPSRGRPFSANRIASS
jgi:hypothetical protein